MKSDLSVIDGDNRTTPYVFLAIFFNYVMSWFFVTTSSFASPFDIFRKQPAGLGFSGDKPR
jgi:hypothetical protein